MKTAIIDIGSNSVRLAMLADGKTLYKRLATTRLGGGLSLTGKLSEDAIERSAQAVSGFKSAAEAEGAEKVYAFATAAVRSSSNKEQFINRVYSLCGLNIEVLSGEQEATTGLLGALKGRDGGILDIGGASTEITVQKEGTIPYAISMDIGAVRLFDLAERNRDRLEKVIAEKIRPLDFDLSRFDMYAIGGTATTLAAVKHGFYEPKITDGTVFEIEEVRSTAEKLLSMSVEEVRALGGVEPRRADIIGGGCLMMYLIMKKSGIGRITVSESDNLEGFYMLKGGKL